MISNDAFPVCERHRSLPRTRTSNKQRHTVPPHVQSKAAQQKFGALNHIITSSVAVVRGPQSSISRNSSWTPNKTIAESPACMQAMHTQTRSHKHLRLKRITQVGETGKRIKVYQVLSRKVKTVPTGCVQRVEQSESLHCMKMNVVHQLLKNAFRARVRQKGISCT